MRTDTGHELFISEKRTQNYKITSEKELGNRSSTTHSKSHMVALLHGQGLTSVRS